MYYLSRSASVYHIVEEPSTQDAPRTLCGLLCDRVGMLSKQPSSCRLCKNCAKWLLSKDKDDA